MALGAFQVGYNDDSEGPFQGPFPTDFIVENSSLTVIFDNGNTELELRGSDEPWTVGYEVKMI